MSGNYSIVRMVPHPCKFACYVKFNEEIDPEFYSPEKYPEGGEYWEYDSVVDRNAIASALQNTADLDLAHWETIESDQEDLQAIRIGEDGRIAL